jgi:hypothetical protein
MIPKPGWTRWRAAASFSSTYETMRAFANMKWIDALARVLIVGGLGTLLPAQAADLEGSFDHPQASSRSSSHHTS